MVEPKLPDIVTLVAEAYKEYPFAKYLHSFDNAIYSLIIILILTLLAILVSRKSSLIPSSRLQNAAELIAGGIDDFVCGILGPKGRRYTPFIGTLFIYILCMNLFVLIPFMKSATSSWSTTLGLAICVFCYVQYTAVREMGFFGYIDHLAGKPRGVMAFSVVLPLLILILHILSEFIKPISLSLRLRSNIWGDDLLLAVLAGFGVKGAGILLFNMLAAVLTAVVQAVVFALLSTIYFALVLTEEENSPEREKDNLETPRLSA